MARSLNGTSDKIAANAAHLTNAGVAFTIAGWIKKSARANDALYGEGSTGAAGPFAELHLDGTTGQHIEFAARSGASGSADTITGTLTAADGTWHHIAVTQDSSNNIALFVDGTADTTGARTALSNTPGQVFNTATLGAVVRNTTSSFFSGTMAHVATWSRQLSAAEIKTLAAGVPPSLLGPDHYWPLWGTDSPEPDIGTATHVTGTLTGTTAATGSPVGLGLLLLSTPLNGQPTVVIPFVVPAQINATSTVSGAILLPLAADFPFLLLEVLH